MCHSRLLMVEFVEKPRFFIQVYEQMHTESNCRNGGNCHEASDGSVATHLLLRLGFMVCVREVFASSVETSCSAAAGTLT